MLCVILSHPNLRRCKVEEMESGRDNEVATGLSGNSPSERKDRSRPRTSWPARPWGHSPQGQGYVLALHPRCWVSNFPQPWRFVLGGRKCNGGVAWSISLRVSWPVSLLTWGAVASLTSYIMSMKQLHPMSVNFLKRLTEHQWIYLWHLSHQPPLPSQLQPLLQSHLYPTLNDVQFSQWNSP